MEPAPAPSAWTYHHGPTFEINFGFGRMFQPNEFVDGLHPAFGGPDVSLGGWLTRRLALTWRLAGTLTTYNNGTTAHVIVGPSLQLWFTESLWAGATVGRSFVRTTRSGPDDGWGFELRAGVTLNQGSASTINLSLDLTPGFHSRNDFYDMSEQNYTGLALLLGYQYL